MRSSHSWLGGGRHRFGSIVQQRVQALQARAAVADDRDADRDVLADRGGVDVDVHDRGLGGEGVRLAGDPVVEPDPDPQEQVAGAGAHVGGVGAMHAEHPQEERVVSGESPEAHEGGRDRGPGSVRQPRQLFRAAGEDNPASGEDQRAPGLGQQPRCRPKLFRVGLRVGGVGAGRELEGSREPGAGRGDVLGDVHEHGAGTSRAGQVKRLLEDGREVGDVFDEVVVLGAGAGDADDVHLLEGVVADQVSRHLTGEHDDGDRVREGRGDAGHGVRRPRPGGHQADPHLARSPRVAVGGVDGPLLVPDEDVADRRARQFVIDVDHGPSGEPEERVHPFALQHLHQNPGAGHLHGSSPVVSRAKKNRYRLGAGNGFCSARFFRVR